MEFGAMKRMNAMKKIIFATLCAFGFGFVSPVAAQTSQTNAPATAVQRSANPALWVVKDADTTIYLFGTFHALPANLNWNLGAVKTAFESADTLRLEIANLETDAAAIREIAMQKGRLPEGQKLTDGLTPAQKQELGRVVSEAGLPQGAVDSMRPWMASVALTGILAQKLGLDPERGVDKTLDRLARARGIPVEGFETGAEQVGFLAGFDAPTQRAMLLSTLEDWDQYQKLLDDMVAAWATGNPGKIDRLISGSLRDQPALARVLLTDRNKRWADWIGARMAVPGTVFVAVGAGHLVGRDSVQSFLRAKGLRAARVANRAR
jgi:uncharacterized protein